MDRAILTKNTLRHYFIVNDKGTATLPCSSTTKPEYGIRGSKSTYYKIYLRAITQENLDKVLSLLEDTPIIPFIEVSKYFMEGKIFSNQLKEGYSLPTKGEKVIVTVSKSTTFYISNIDLIPRYIYKRISDEDIFPLLKTFKNYYNGN